MLLELRFALRQLAKAPGFTLVAVLTLALGIGATTTLFSVLKAFVLDPFPYPAAERIVFVWSDTGEALSGPDFLDLRAQARSLQEFGAFSPQRYNLGGEQPESVSAVLCTAGVLRTLGIPPQLGRWLEAADEAPGAPPVAVISHRLWTRGFAADRTALGRTILLDGRPCTIVGIMPPDFEFASPWHDGHDRELWLPAGFADQPRGNRWLLGIGRLKDGVTLAAADAEFKAIGTRLAQSHPETNRHHPFLVRSLRQEMTERTAASTSLLFGAVLLLLLVACANVAGLLLARGTLRQGEFGVRLALGASPGSILRQLLGESLLLALLSGGVGIVLAAWGLDGVRHLLPPLLVTEARRAALQLDGGVLAFACALTLLTALAFGLLPALTAARTPVGETLKEDGRSATGSHSRHRFLRQLAGVQIALALVLAYAAVLLSTSYLHVLADNRALNSDHIVTAGVALRGPTYGSNRDQALRLAFWDRLLERVHAMPGVQAAAVSSTLPLEGGNHADFLVDDQTYDPAARRPAAGLSLVSSEYFAALEVPILRGRAPERDDAQRDQQGVAINRTLAEKYWPGQDPLGKRIRTNAAHPWFNATVVGVVGDVRQQGSDQRIQPEIYFHHAHRNVNAMTLVVHVAGDAALFVQRLRTELAQLDPDLPLADVRTLREVVAQNTGPRRFLTWLNNGFMLTALLLAMVGIYGTLSFILLQRRREIGVRIALGAGRLQLIRFIFRLVASLVGGGVALGLVASLGVAFVLRPTIYGLRPLDPLSLLIGLALIGGATGLACLVPALRALRINPLEALHAR